MRMTDFFQAIFVGEKDNDFGVYADGYDVAGEKLKNVLFVCEAGMGSSTLGAETLKNKLRRDGYGQITVSHCAADSVPHDAQMIVTYKELAPQVKKQAPKSEILMVKNFLQSDVYAYLLERLNGVKKLPAVEMPGTEEQSINLLHKENIKLGLKSVDKDEAIRMAGSLLLEGGYVERDYVEAMLERENDITTYIGKGIAIPHGVNRAKSSVKETGMVVLQFPEGVKFGNEKAKLVIGLAAKDEGHLAMLAKLAQLFEDDAVVEKLSMTQDSETVYNILMSAE